MSLLILLTLISASLLTLSNFFLYLYIFHLHVDFKYCHVAVVIMVCAKDRMCHSEKLLMFVFPSNCLDKPAVIIIYDAFRNSPRCV